MAGNLLSMRFSRKTSAGVNDCRGHLATGGRNVTSPPQPNSLLFFREHPWRLSWVSYKIEQIVYQYVKCEGNCSPAFQPWNNSHSGALKSCVRSRNGQVWLFPGCSCNDWQEMVHQLNFLLPSPGKVTEGLLGGTWQFCFSERKREAQMQPLRVLFADA